MTKQLVTESRIDAAPELCCQSDSAEQLVLVLRKESDRVVLAESCTAGWAATALGAIPGFSDLF